MKTQKKIAIIMGLSLLTATHAIAAITFDDAGASNWAKQAANVMMLIAILIAVAYTGFKIYQMVNGQADLMDVLKAAGGLVALIALSALAYTAFTEVKSNLGNMSAALNEIRNLT